MPSYDLLVIGSGPAGHHAAIQGAKLGKRVAVIERRDVVGGVCVNTGTIPSKTLREAVLYLSGFRQRGLYGVSYAVKKDITVADLMFRCDRVMQSEIEVMRAQFQRNRVPLLTGEASFVDPHHVQLASAAICAQSALSGASPTGDPRGVETIIEAAQIVIATGTTPAHSPNVPIDGKTIIDSDSIFCLSTIPRSMIIVGGGVIGVEYACMFATLGVAVTLIEMRPKLLEFVDDEIVEALGYHMRDNNVTLRLGEEVERVEKTSNGRVAAHLKSHKVIVGETLLYAVGRQGNTAGLHLAAAGLEADARGRIAVDARFRTRVPHIHAVGDVIGFPALASVAMEQGRLAARDAFNLPAHSAPALFPYGIYTIPEISFVGQSEEALTRDDVPYEVGIARYREIARGQIIGDTSGMLKLIFHRETRKLLGVHIIGEGASELVHIGQAVLTFDGTIDYFVDNVFNYPTLAECYKVAALAGVNKLAT